MAAPHRPNLDAVSRLARRYAQANSLSPPVDVEGLLAAKATIDLAHDLPKGWDALLYECDGGLRVVLSTVPHLNRRRFTIGHELGHIVIPWHPLNVVCHEGGDNTSSWYAMEREADAFSGRVLVPDSWLQQYVDDDIADALPRITNGAKVSLEAAAWRLAEVLPAATAYWLEVSDGFRFFMSPHWTARKLSQEPSPDVLHTLRDEGAVVTESSVGRRRLVVCTLKARPCMPRATGEPREVLRKILAELDMLDREASINGVISGGFQRRTGSSAELIFDALCQRFVGLPWAAPLVRHPKFNRFLAIRAKDLSARTRK